MLKKPKELFQNKTYLITFYGNYDIAENLLYLPNIFSNFTNNTVDLSDPIELKKQVKEIFDDWLDDEVEEADISRIKERPIYLYVIPFENQGDHEDDEIDFEDIITQIEVPFGKITMDEYHLLIGKLSQQQLIELDYTKLHKQDKREIKDYGDVKIGDMAMENPDAGGEWDKPIGKILWKGTFEDLVSDEKYFWIAADWENEDDVDPQEYDLVIVDVKGDFGEITLFNYNNDPSGVVVFKDYTIK